ncbi:small nuclear RNA activating complex polypeptide 5, partial [Chelydra serpentina]
GGRAAGRMLSRLQELRKEEETLLRVKAALHDQLNRLKVEELALQSMISSSEKNVMASPPGITEETQKHCEIFRGKML